jgi:hypothetical protein
MLARSEQLRRALAAACAKWASDMMENVEAPTRAANRCSIELSEYDA